MVKSGVGAPKERCLATKETVSAVNLDVFASALLTKQLFSTISKSRLFSPKLMEDDNAEAGKVRLFTNLQVDSVSASRLPSNNNDLFSEGCENVLTSSQSRKSM